jgi:hypothetical protein
MLAMVLLLPLSLAMDNGEFNHDGGSGGGGGPVAVAAAAVAAVAAVDNNLRRNKSINGHMTACNDKQGWQKTTQQPTNDGRSKGGQWWWR